MPDRAEERETWHAERRPAPVKRGRGSQKKNPPSIDGYRKDDVVITPLGKKAVITSCRCDGKFDAKYLGTPWQAGAETILDPRHIRKAPLPA